MEQGTGYLCSRCGKWHEDLPLSFGADAPYYYEVIEPAEREKRVQLSSDQCVIDGEHFFLRSCLEIPIIGSHEVFIWDVWVSISSKNFARAQQLWDDPARIDEPPYFGWLSSRVPIYPDTMDLKTNLYSRAPGERPFVVLEPTEHPLAVEQQNGITMTRVAEIASILLHDNIENG